MCGIAGIYRYGKEPIKEELISMLLVGNEHRGNDAAGMAFMQADGSVQVCKSQGPAWTFVTSDRYEEFINEYLLPDTVAVIVHARGASQGTPHKNDNNHPMYDGHCAVIHNGSIKNDNELFRELKLERKADTDSDILRAIIDEYGFGDLAIKNLNKIRGSVAGACISPDYPGKLLLFKSGPPLALASTDNFFIFSSEKKTIWKAFRPVVNRFKIPFQVTQGILGWSTIPEHTAWILGPDGKESHAELKTLYHGYQDPVRRVYEGYSERTAAFDKAAQKETKRAVGLLYPCSKCGHLWQLPAGYNDPEKCYCHPEKGGCGGQLKKEGKQEVVASVN